jgi:hypothetical protein
MTLSLLLLRGVGMGGGDGGVVTIPDAPGLEYVMDESKMHYAMVDSRVHYDFQKSRLHYKIKDEDR